VTTGNNNINKSETRLGGLTYTQFNIALSKRPNDCVVPAAPGAKKQYISKITSIQNQTRYWLPEFLKKNNYPTPTTVSWDNQATTAFLFQARKHPFLRLVWYLNLDPTKNPLKEQNHALSLLNSRINMTINSNRTMNLYIHCACGVPHIWDNWARIYFCDESFDIHKIPDIKQKLKSKLGPAFFLAGFYNEYVQQCL